MKKYLAKAINKSEGYAMFIGRWQPWHFGHRWLIDEALEEGKKVLICIRDIEPDDKNPWTAHEVMLNIFKELQDLVEKGKVKIITIPDIESINIGREVGYDIIEHIPPQEIYDISGTEIRRQMKESKEV